MYVCVCVCWGPYHGTNYRKPYANTHRITIYVPCSIPYTYYLKYICLSPSPPTFHPTNNASLLSHNENPFLHYLFPCPIGTNAGHMSFHFLRKSHNPCAQWPHTHTHTSLDDSHTHSYINVRYYILFDRAWASGLQAVSSHNLLSFLRVDDGLVLYESQLIPFFFLSTYLCSSHLATINLT